MAEANYTFQKSGENDDGNGDGADDNQQRDVMQSQFPMFWSDANVQGITIWGYIVGATWKANTGLLTSTGTMRPAMTWLVDYLANNK